MASASACAGGRSTVTRMRTNRDLASWRVLDRVFQQISDNAGEQDFIRFAHGVERTLGRQDKTPGAGQWKVLILQPHEEPGQRESRLVDRHHAGVEFGYVQERVDLRARRITGDYINLAFCHGLVDQRQLHRARRVPEP